MIYLSLFDNMVILSNTLKSYDKFNKPLFNSILTDKCYIPDGVYGLSEAIIIGVYVSVVLDLIIG